MSCFEVRGEYGGKEEPDEKGEKDLFAVRIDFQQHLKKFKTFNKNQ